MVTNAQRALWTFLMYALVAPFFAALAATLALGIPALFEIVDLIPGASTSIGGAALATFVWSAVPALITALACGAVVLRSGGLSWMVAAAIGVIAFALASVLLPTAFEDARPYLAFLAGLVSLAVRQVLLQAGIIRS